jgi:hypothetical protein
MKLIYIFIAIIITLSNDKLQAQKTEAQLLQYLQTYRGGNSQHVYPCSFISDVNITDSVKSRLLNLLRNQWTIEELKPIVDVSFKKEFDYMYFEDIVNTANANSKIIFFNSFSLILSNSKKDSITTVSSQYHLVYDNAFKRTYDSTLLIYRKQVEKKIKETPVSNELVKLAANIGLKEAIPLFKNDLASASKHLYNPEIAELALAKLGDKVLYKKILNECSYNGNLIDFDSIRYEDNGAWRNDFYSKFGKLSFLNTQESIYQLHNWLDTSKTSINQEFSNGYIDFAYSANRVLEELYRLFGRYDLVKEWRKRDPRKSPETAAAILSFKKWMIENKGKYVIKQICPD